MGLLGNHRSSKCKRECKRIRLKRCCMNVSSHLPPDSFCSNPAFHKNISRSTSLARPCKRNPLPQHCRIDIESSAAVPGGHYNRICTRQGVVKRREKVENIPKQKIKKPGYPIPQPPYGIFRTSMQSGSIVNVQTEFKREKPNPGQINQRGARMQCGNRS